MTGDDPDRERFSRIAELFHQGLELPAADRPAWVDAIRRDHADLADEVAALLGAHDRAAAFIERPALSEETRHSRALPPVPRDPIGHYRVLSVIGEGGMGVVYLAEDTRLGRTVALKAVRSALANDATRVARLRREARAAAGLTHPNIATVYALEEFDGTLYLVTEHVAGETLRDELARGPLPPARVRDVGRAVASALAAAHARGIVHRDIKPENIVTTTKGDVKVLDFGLAQVSDGSGDERHTADGAVLGTPAYMAPEQIRGGVVDGRADLFALGVTLYELATGHHPFSGATPAVTIARILEDRPVPLRTRLSATSRLDPAAEALEIAAAQCLEKPVASRPESAERLAAMLTPRSDEGPPATPRHATVDGGVTNASAWWWQFHQAATVAAYLLLLVPLWNARGMTTGPAGSTLFFLGLVAAVISAMLRLHLWFALRQFPGDWARDHRGARRLRQLADGVFAVVLAARGFTAIRVDDPSAALFLSAAAAVAVSFVIIEPATTKAMGMDRK